MDSEQNVHDPARARGLRTAREIDGHLTWLDSFTPLALGVLSAASGIYTYLGVSGLLEDQGALTFFAALAYSLAVSVGIFVFWSYMLRLVPSMTHAGGLIGMGIATLVGSLAIVAMSSWLNAAALAGSAAVEQHLARTVQDYTGAVERAHANAVAGQSLSRDVARARSSFEDLSELERSGELSGVGGQGAVYRLLRQKSAELAALESQIAAQEEPIAAAFERGNEILGRMRGIIAEPGPVQQRSVIFAEQSVRLAGVIAELRQLSVAPLVARAAEDLGASVVLPSLDGATADVRSAQSSTIRSVMAALENRARGLEDAAQEVLDLPEPRETTYAPISTADAVIRYAGDFVPAWAGAVAIDLLPLVLVFVLAVSRAAIRRARGEMPYETGLSVVDLQAALSAMRALEAAGAMRAPQPGPGAGYGAGYGSGYGGGGQPAPPPGPWGPPAPPAAPPAPSGPPGSVPPDPGPQG